MSTATQTTGPRLTPALRAVVAELGKHNARTPAYGSAIAKAVGLLPASVYAILDRLEAHGWVRSWEETGRLSRGGRRRRYCVLTVAGRTAERRLQRQATTGAVTA